MKSTSILLFLGLCLHVCQAQIVEKFGVINDPDGYTNVREEASSTSKIVTKIYDNQPFYIGSGDADIKVDIPINGWVGIERKGSLAFMTDKEKEQLSEEEKEKLKDGGTGNIHSSRIYDITSGEQLKAHEIGGDFIIYSDGEVSFMMKSGPFDINEHVIHEKYPQVEKIDGISHWGTDGGLPRNEFKWIKVVMGDKVVNVPKEQFQFFL